MMGYALQKGLLPVSLESIEEAIRLNGTFVKGNLRTLALGRVAAHAPEALASELTQQTDHGHIDTTEGLIASRARSEEHTSELQSLMRTSYAVFCLKKKKPNNMKQQQP